MSAVLETSTEQVRLMNHDDLSVIMGIETRAYDFPWSEGIFRDCMRVGYSCWVYELDCVILGYGVVSLGVGECHVLNLCVAPDAQNQGIGRKLLQHLLDTALCYNIDTVLLEVRPSNPAAISLYTSEGFNEVGRRKDYYPARHGREDALILAKAL